MFMFLLNAAAWIFVCLMILAILGWIVGLVFDAIATIAKEMGKETKLIIDGIKVSVLKIRERYRRTAQSQSGKTYIECRTDRRP